MNNLLIQIKNKIGSINNFFKINPHKHWNFILSIFLILICCLVLFSFYLLYQIKNEQIFQVSKTEPINTVLLKEPMLKNINEIYDKRASNVLDIKSKPSVYSDPSL